MSDKLQQQSFNGYYSINDKKIYMKKAGILGALSLILMFLIPILIGMVFFISTFLKTPIHEKNMLPNTIYFYRSAASNNAIYLISQDKSKINSVGNTNTEYSLFKYDTVSTFKTKDLGKIDFKEPYLLNTKKGIMIISREKVGLIDNDRIKVILSDCNLKEILSVFLVNDNPAIFEKDSNTIKVKILEGNNWETIYEFTLKKNLQLNNQLNGFYQNGFLYIFIKFTDYLYYKKISFDDNFDNKPWNKIHKVVSWKVVNYKDNISVFYNIDKNGKFSIKGIRLNNEKWEEFFSQEFSLIIAFGVFSRSNNSLDFLIISFPGCLNYLRYENSAIVENKFEEPFAFSMFKSKNYLLLNLSSQSFIYIFPFVFSLILIPIIKKHKVTSFENKGMVYRFSPIWKRGLAQGVDMLFVLIPIWWNLSKIYSKFFDLQTMANPYSLFLDNLKYIFAFLIWSIILLFIFSVLEGRYGKTPGKWIFKIKVVDTDLKMIGFGRALLRNILQLFDKMFAFMVGLMLITFTEKWQRLGDLAARSIVIEDKNELDGNHGK